MSEMLLVLRREFRERVATRAFVLGTLLFPLLIAAVMILPSLFDGGEERTLAVVDEAPAGIAERFVTVLGAPPADEDADRYTLRAVPGPLADARAELQRQVTAEEIDGYVVFPADVLETNRVLYRAGTIASPGMLRDLRAAASEAVQAERLRRAGLQGGEVASLIARVEVDNARISATGEERGDAESTFFVAYFLAFAIYLMVALYGVGVMRSVLEEKTNRIAEVLVSSMRATHLMAGKILGVALAALLQVGVWTAVIAPLLITQSEWIAERAGIPPETLRAVAIEPGTAALLLIFFALGFLLFAALFAALGAAVTSDQEAQSFQMVLMLPLFLPLVFLVPLTSEPLGSVATALGLFPLTAPVAMPMRMASTALPPLQIVLSLALLLLGLAATAWVAGKIYRIGILSTGKRPTLRELGRWLRTA